MALRSDDLNRVQRELEARSRLETERAIARLLAEYDELTESLQPDRQGALDALTRGDLERAERLIRRMDRHVAQWLRARAPAERVAIERMARQAALRGAQAVDLAPLTAVRPNAAVEEMLRALSRAAAGGGVRFGGSTIGVGYNEIAEAVKQQISRKVYQDGLNLSRRLHTRLAEQRVAFNNILASGLQEGRSAIRIARQIQTLDVTDARFPKYLRDLDRTLRGTRDASLVDEIRRAAAEAAKRKAGPLGLRGPSMRVVQAARSGVAERMDEALEYFLQRKVRYHAIVIARTETNEAYRVGHVERAKESSFVVGIKWHLSASHRRSCECEELAARDAYGLGPGVYPPDELPERPHPQCFCFFSDVVDLRMFEGVA